MDFERIFLQNFPGQKSTILMITLLKTSRPNFLGPTDLRSLVFKNKFEGLPGLLIDVFQKYVYKNLKKFLAIHKLIFFKKLLYGLTGQKSWGL